MSSCPKFSPIILFTTVSVYFVFFHFAPNSVVVDSQADHSSLEWSFNATPFVSLDEEAEEFDFEDGHFQKQSTEDHGGTGDRRLLHYYHRSSAPVGHRYYISYGALSANRVPCPPRSGRSYYTHNCHQTSSPVNPYTRGCSSITRCRR